MDSGFGQELGRIARRLGIAGDTRAPRSLDLMTSDGVRLRANDWGGDSSPVLLLHGGSLTARTWDYVCVGLRDRFRMLTIDQRGHGESGWSNDYSVARLAMDAVEAVEQLAGGPARLVGMSLGGLAAAEAAALRPDLLVSLSIVDVAPGVSYEASANMRGFMTGMIGAPSVEAVVEAALRASPQSDPERLAYRMRAMLRQNDAGLWIWKRDGRRMVDFPHILARVQAMGNTLSGFDRPLLMVRGGRSKVLTRSTAEAFAATFPKGHFIEICDAGHNVQEDQPLALIEALCRFWTEADLHPDRTKFLDTRNVGSS